MISRIKAEIKLFFHCLINFHKRISSAPVVNDKIMPTALIGCWNCGTIYWEAPCPPI